jgi:hypothetical protein
MKDYGRKGSREFRYLDNLDRGDYNFGSVDLNQEMNSAKKVGQLSMKQAEN